MPIALPALSQPARLGWHGAPGQTRQPDVFGFGEGLGDKPDPPDVRQVGRGPAPEECPPDPPDVWQVGRASVIFQMQTLLTTNLSVQVNFRAFAEVARPAGHPAGRAGNFLAHFGTNFRLILGGFRMYFLVYFFKPLIYCNSAASLIVVFRFMPIILIVFGKTFFLRAR